MAVPSLDPLINEMEQACEALNKKLSSLRAGRADSALFDHLTVEVYGGRMPLSQVATVNVGQGQTLSVQVWDANNTTAVDKTLQSHGYCPQVEGQNLRVPLPTLTEERRLDLIKTAKKYTEETNVGLRIVRQKFLQGKPKDLSEDEARSYKKEIDETIKVYEKKAEQLFKMKEKEIRQP